MNPSTAMARVLVDELAQQCTEVVLAPGSRSAPLAYALHAADVAGRLRLHVRIDERSAGFLALGLAKARGRPVAVVTTSGTATANLHPAVFEADASGVPLVVLTADRPAELRGTGANQTADQVKLFGSAVREFVDVAAPEERAGLVRYWRNVVARALAAALGLRTAAPGPVHLNVAFREPLVPDIDGADEWVEPLDGARGHTAVLPRAGPAWHYLPAGPRTVVVAGDDGGRDGWEARWLAETAGWPLLAEPSSGARSGPNALGPYRLLLDHEPLTSGIERVVAYGRPTLSRPVTRLLGRHDVELVVVSGHGAQWVDPGRAADLVVPAAALEGTQEGAGRAEPDAWLEGWLAADSAAREAVAGVLDAEPALTGPAVARVVAGSLRPSDVLVAGSSNPIRDLDLAGAPFTHPLLTGPRGGVDVGAHVRVLANRGVAGIDGTVSTAVGAALGHGSHAVALLGDLTFLHDAAGLFLGPAEPRPDLTLVVVNDDGGGIFGLLEQGAPEHAAAFERVFGTQTGVDLAALCAATGTRHTRASSEGQLRSALTPRRGLQVVEVPVDRTTARDLHARIKQSFAAAVHRLPLASS